MYMYKTAIYITA